MCSAYLNSAKCKCAVAFVSVCVFVCAVTNKPFNHAFRGRAHAIKSCGQDIIVQCKENHQPCIAIHLKSLGFQGKQTCSAKKGYSATVFVRSNLRRDLAIWKSLHFSSPEASAQMSSMLDYCAMLLQYLHSGMPHRHSAGPLVIHKSMNK